MTLPVTILIVILIALVFGGAFSAFFSPIIGIPLALIGIAVVGFAQFYARRKQAGRLREFREEAEPERTDFMARDKQTLT